MVRLYTIKYIAYKFNNNVHLLKKNGWFCLLNSSSNLFIIIMHILHYYLLTSAQKVDTIYHTEHKITKALLFENNNK